MSYEYIGHKYGINTTKIQHTFG